MTNNVTWSSYETVILYKIENSLFIDALDLISQFGQSEDPKIICAHAKCLIGLKRYSEALDILLETERKGWNIPEILSLKGGVLYMLGEYESAKSAFQEANRFEPNQSHMFWIQRCEVRIAAQNEEISRRIIKVDPHVFESSQNPETPT